MRRRAVWILPSGEKDPHGAAETARRGLLWKVSAAVLLVTWLPSTPWAQVDAVFANSDGPNRVCLGDGSGGFSCSDVSTDANSTFGVALGFVNGDEHLDAVFANYLQPNRLCLGDGSAGFSCSDLSADTNRTRGVALGFVDGDEHLDAVFAIAGWPDPQPNRVCLGDGSAGFSCSDLSAFTNQAVGVALGFVDEDSSLDAVFGGFPSNVCLGDGDGGFSCSEISGGHSSNPALGFVDGDGNLDVVFSGVYGFPWIFSRVCLGDGSGGFSCSDAQGGGSDVALAKIDGDDHLDAVFAREVSDTVECLGNAICLGDGNGDFSACLGIPADVYCSLGVALGLVDGDDHHLDAVFANYPNDKPDEPNQVCLGDGSGGFACSDVSADANTTLDVALGDVNSHEIFTDGFESGDTLAWSNAVP